MKIKSVQLKNFKRFTDLTIENIPEQAKLVLLIGANGSGKSSLFDGFRKALIPPFGQGYSEKFPMPKVEIEAKNFYKKANSEETITDIQLHSGEILGSNGINNTVPIANYWLRKFVGRSSIRVVSRIPVTSIDLDTIENDADTPVSSIDNDNRFVNDLMGYIHQINQSLRGPLFERVQIDSQKVFKDLIEPLNQSLTNILGNDNALSLALVDIKDIPSEPAELIFQKGNSRINYDLLSHGEKQVVVLLLNFIVRKKQYEDAIIYIDEMDCHLNTALQETLLKEIVEKWIPESSQLWTASHALGFIDYACKTENAVILDFDSLNFDIPQIIIPELKEVLDVYDIAIPKSILSQLFSDKKIVFCEGQNDVYYNLMGLEKTLFIDLKGSKEVFLRIKNDKSEFTLRDRDFISDAEILRIQKNFPNHRILKYYAFENYLYHPENIAELSPKGFDKEKYQAEILQQKKDKIHYILPKIEAARKTYEEFKTDFTEKDIKNHKDIVDDFVSDDFERFYKFFDMKEPSTFNRSYLAQFNLTIKALSSTNWFKTQIGKILQ
jgi:AAA15 family ATPase/GTPase